MLIHQNILLGKQQNLVAQMSKKILFHLKKAYLQYILKTRLLIHTLRKQSYQINKNLLLVFMQQNYFVLMTKNFAKSIKSWLFQQNVLLGQQINFFCMIFFLSVY